MDQSRGRTGGSNNPSADLSNKASALGEQAQAKLEEAAEPLKNKARGMAEEQKSAGADHIAELGRVVHGAAEELGKELPQAAGYIHAAADRLEGASSALRERSVEDLVGTFTNFARTQPVAAFAGSVLAGFALSRFLKSSSANAEHRS
jgi:hypothetical protein